MARYIDADALCKGLVSNHPVVIYAKNAPTIEAEPTWEQVKEYCEKRCFVILDRGTFNDIKARCDGTKLIKARCPNCGAKMMDEVLGKENGDG